MLTTAAAPFPRPPAVQLVNGELMQALYQLGEEIRITETMQKSLLLRPVDKARLMLREVAVLDEVRSRLSGVKGIHWEVMDGCMVEIEGQRRKLLDDIALLDPLLVQGEGGPRPSPAPPGGRARAVAAVVAAVALLKAGKVARGPGAARAAGRVRAWAAGAAVAARGVLGKVKLVAGRKHMAEGVDFPLSGTRIYRAG